VKKSIVLSAGSVVAASAMLGLFGTGVAAADDYAGQTYADASSAASDSGLTSIVAARVGDKLSQDECLVTRSQTAPFADADDGAHYSGIVQFYLNCAGAYASATNPGASVASPAGREAKAAADEAAAEAAAEEEAALEEVSTPDE
jgi:pyruvate/2-oxoglutarate dehydrogenase complex dihydrolipoamide acyltransferase (E2) component